MLRSKSFTLREPLKVYGLTDAVVHFHSHGKSTRSLTIEPVIIPFLASRINLSMAIQLISSGLADRTTCELKERYRRIFTKLFTFIIGTGDRK